MPERCMGVLHSYYLKCYNEIHKVVNSRANTYDHAKFVVFISFLRNATVEHADESGARKKAALCPIKNAENNLFCSKSKEPCGKLPSPT